jgi:hypothetical protein
VLLCGICLAPVFRASGGQLTNVQTVFVIVMENQNWARIFGDTNCPYINNTLLHLASRAERYFTPTNLHPSEPNYIWLEAGTNFGIRDDGLPAINHISSTNHLVTLLENAGITWKTYQESYIGGTDPLTNNYPYVARHNPFVFFDDIATNQARLTNHFRPYSELSPDLQANNVARYNFITPNITNDMHDAASVLSSPRRQGDDWLAREAPKILASAAYTNNGALFILWDEGDNNISDGPIGLLLLSPLAKFRGYANHVHYTHSSLLRTLQEIFGVGPLLGDAAQATDLEDLFADDRLSFVPWLSLIDGVPQLTLVGLEAGKTHVIQLSNNLLDWQPLHTNFATTTTISLADFTASNSPQRFYRALELR